MRRALRNAPLSTTSILCACIAAPEQAAAAIPVVTPTYQHVRVISVDGMHAIDLIKSV